jgi:CRISPR-associated exonuclease Cas4
MSIVPLFLLLAALLLWLLAHLARRGSGLPSGVVVYSDSGGWMRTEKPLYSQALRLTGKPDYLVQSRRGLLPVELKSMRAPAGGPHPAHIYQLAAYCALVEDSYGHRPSHGLIKYADKTLAVSYTRQLEQALRALLDEIQAIADASDVARSHDSPARCRGCGFLAVCDESLVDA